MVGLRVQAPPGFVNDTTDVWSIAPKAAGGLQRGVNIIHDKQIIIWHNLLEQLVIKVQVLFVTNVRFLLSQTVHLAGFTPGNVPIQDQTWRCGFSFFLLAVLLFGFAPTAQKPTDKLKVNEANCKNRIYLMFSLSFHFSCIISHVKFSLFSSWEPNITSKMLNLLVTITAKQAKPPHDVEERIKMKIIIKYWSALVKDQMFRRMSAHFIH